MAPASKKTAADDMSVVESLQDVVAIPTERHTWHEAAGVDNEE